MRIMTMRTMTARFLAAAVSCVLLSACGGSGPAPAASSAVQEVSAAASEAAPEVTSEAAAEAEVSA